MNTTQQKAQSHFATAETENRRWVRSAAVRYLLCGVFCVSLGVRANGQGTFAPVVMRTGTGNVLLTNSIAYNVAGQAIDVLAFNFGFATQEQALPGQFDDSFTISITGPSGTAYLVTADANGIVWAPAVPGSIGVTESAIQRQIVPFGIPSEGLTPVAAYQVDYMLPPTWQSSPLVLNFDLFDNQNLQESLAYVAVMQVPEPSSVKTLLLAGLLLWIVAKSTSPRTR